MRYALAISLSMTLLLSVVALGQVYPIRWSNEPPESETAAATATAGAAVMGALRLVPKDVPPVACSASTEGMLYVQKDNAGFSPTFGVVLCWCTRDDGAGVYKYYSTGNNDCSVFVAP